MVDVGADMVAEREHTVAEGVDMAGRKRRVGGFFGFR